MPRSSTLRFTTLPDETHPESPLLTARQVADRYHTTFQSLWRWLRDERMGFPKPVYLGRLRYWRLEELEAWEATRPRSGRK